VFHSVLTVECLKAEGCLPVWKRKVRTKESSLLQGGEKKPCKSVPQLSSNGFNYMMGDLLFSKDKRPERCKGEREQGRRAKYAKDILHSAQKKLKKS
jgi:hypothetical protein